MTDKDLNPELIQISQKYLRKELSQKLSTVWDKVSVFIYGSVSYGMADEFSNANLEVIYPDNELQKTSTLFVQKDGKEIKVDFSPWSKNEGYLVNLPQNDESVFWVIQIAIILHDPDKRFQKIQEKINQYLPDEVWKTKIFGKWFDIAFNGVKKALRRNEIITVQICKGKMIQAMLEITFLLNRQYIPPVKWLHLKFLELPLLSKEVEPYLQKVLEAKNVEDMEMEEKAIWNIFNSYIKEKTLLPSEVADEPWLYDSFTHPGCGS